MATLVSTYVAIVVTQVASPYVAQFFAGQTTVGSVFIKASPTPFIIETALFLGITLLLTTKAGLSGIKGHGILSPFELAIYSVLNSGIILATILTYFDAGTRSSILAQSNLATIINQYHDLWLIAPVLVLIIMGFRKPGRD